MDEVLKKYLEKFNICYKIHEHPATFTVAESLKIDKNIPGLHCKTLFLKDEKNHFYLIGLRATKRLDIKNLQNNLQVKKLKFSSEEELYSNLKIKPGNVSIFNLMNSQNLEDISLIIDEEVWNSDIVGFHPNINTETLEINHLNLERYYNSIKTGKLIISL